MKRYESDFLLGKKAMQIKKKSSLTVYFFTVRRDSSEMTLVDRTSV